MSDLNLTSFNPLYPMRIHPYKELLNDSNVNIMDKVNAVIDYLNQVGKLTNDVVKDWNTVYQWVMNDGLTTDVNNKLEAMLANHEFDPIMNNILTKIGDLTTLQTVDKDTLVHSINDLVAEIGSLSSLQTSDKSSVVNAINENTSQLAESASKITNRKVFDLGLYYGDTTTDMVDLINQQITNGYTKFLVPNGITFNKTLTLLNLDDGIEFEASKPLPVTMANRATIQLNTGGVGIRLSGCNNVVFRNISFNTFSDSSLTLSNPSTVAIVQQRSALHDYSQWHVFDNVTINMHTDPTANGGKGTIGVYNDTAELGHYRNLNVSADIPIVLTRDNIYGIADAHRSSSLKNSSFSGTTTLIASYGYAMVWDAISSTSFENLYMVRNSFRGSSTQQYAVLVTGQSVNGYFNYNINILNFDCETFPSSFLVQGLLQSSTITGNHHNVVSGNEVVGVNGANAQLIQVNFKIYNSNNSGSVNFDLIKFYSGTISPVAEGCHVYFNNSYYRMTLANSIAGMVIHSKNKANIVLPTPSISGQTYQYMNLTKDGVYMNGNLVSWSTAIPTSSTYPNATLGDIVFNSSGVVGQVQGWSYDGTNWDGFGQIGYRTAASLPVGSLTPKYIGERFYDSNAQNWWIGVDNTVNTGWKLENMTFRQGAGSPSGVTTPRYLGEDWFDTTNLVWWRSTGTANNTMWKQMSN